MYYLSSLLYTLLYQIQNTVCIQYSFTVLKVDCIAQLHVIRYHHRIGNEQKAQRYTLIQQWNTKSRKEVALAIKQICLKRRFTDFQTSSLASSFPIIVVMYNRKMNFNGSNQMKLQLMTFIISSNSYQKVAKILNIYKSPNMRSSTVCASRSAFTGAPLR